MESEIRPLEHLLALLALARARSYRRAALVTGHSYRMLKRRIDSLEGRLGFSVFRHTTRGLEIAPEAEGLFKKALEFEKVAKEFDHLVSSLSTTLPTPVRVGAPEGLSAFWLLPQAAAFRQAHPEVDLIIQPTRSQLDSSQDQADIKLTASLPGDDRLITTRVATLHFVPCASGAYLDKFGVPATIRELAGHHHVVHTGSSFDTKALLESRIGATLPDRQVTRVANSTAHFVMVERGAGIGFLATYGFAIGAGVRDLDLDIRFSMDIWVSYKPELRENRRARHVIDWIREIFDHTRHPWFAERYVKPELFRGKINEEAYFQSGEIISSR
jgi:DNA-binding transcriptional LysR family regulator